MANIKVAVRVRPISAREVNLTGSEVVVRTGLKEISLTNLKVSSSKAGDSRERTRRYVFDYCFDSSEQQAESYADQGKIYETLGQTVLDAVFSGYNSCLVAYGQSASGKTYTMMGTKDDPGLTPRLCGGLFSRVDEEQENNGKTYRISVSYLEIYNERVRDLLKPSASKGGLRVREHPRLGPYVQGLTHHVVRTLGSLMSYVEEGTRARKTASTLQNPSSSRSHALLTVSVHPESSSVPGHPVTSSSGSSASRRKEISSRANSGGSKLHLVDLAGSESAATCGGIHRLKEGANINKSLVALGNVISALAERGSTGSGPGRRFIPYRDSSLTWLLKDALGGNATTIMLATISPASGSYNETAHTLRFAQRAQSVVNRPVVNEDPVARIIRELKDEVARLKSLLLQQNLQGDSKALCFCGRSQTDEKSNRLEEESRVDESCRSVRKQEDGEERSLDKRRIEGSIRRSNSSDSLTTCEVDSTIKRYGSCEFLASKDRFKGNYNRAKVTELNDEEDEVSEINESVFVDIPTLVAVLIKPDDTLQESSTQIEEICSDEVAEDSIDVEFIEGVAGERSIYEEGEKSESIGERSSSVNSCNASGDTEIEVCPVEERGSILKEKGKFRKQDSMDVGTTPSNLHTSKRFGSVETIQKKKEPIFALERSNTNLEKRSSGDRAKKLNNIREIEDHKTSNRIANLWRDDAVNGKDRLQRKGSNDSDKSSKESGSLSSIKTTSNTRKPSLESLKRKTSKDSSSSSSKEEQILISSLTREKLLQRKNSLEQEPVIRAHTPIQRAKRAEIVAAVTERLYSSRKQQEESASASGIRSPPEGTDVKTGSAIGARSKLQELSRRMLGKRRRVCVDTQTESSRTIRMKDSACLTETPTIICQDVAVLTENHEDCEILGDRVPVLRVKEIATSTEKPKTDIVRRKDVAILANDLEFYDYDVHSPRNDSGILSDDTQNYACSTLSSAEISEFCTESNRKIICTDNSTNTFLLANRSSAVQTTQQEVVGQGAQENKSTNCVGHCCGSVHESCKSVPVSNSERNVISISLPDMINITIESTNVLESRIVMDNSDSTEERMKACTKDREVQTSKINDVREETRFCFKDFIRSTSSQTDGRGFRIENIFQDPNNSSRSCTKIDMASDSMENKRTRNSVTFRNSLGTLYANDSKQDERIVEKYDCFPEARSFVKDGLITEAFISKKRCFNVSPKRRPQSIVYNDPWKNWMASCPANSTQPVNYGRDVGNLSSFWQQNHQIPMTDFSMTCTNCAGVVSASGAQDFGQSQQGSVWSEVEETTDLNTSMSRLEATVVPDHDHGFSDDSLDYNENQISKDTSASKTKKEGDHENRENLCPPDVVAHTKKEILKTSGTVDVESTILGDFEEIQVEIPKKKPDEPLTSSPVHDYKTIILGKTTCAVHENADDESTCGTAEEKKKVSFSNSDVIDKRKDQRRIKQESNPPKSIIKKRKKKSSMENAVQSSNDETDDSQQEDKTCANLENACRGRDRRGRGRSGNLEDSSKLDKDFDDSNEESKETNRKKVKFIVENVSKDSSDPENNENTEEEDEDVENETSSSRNILEEYLDEAVTFMRNMNSINEYMSATRMFEKSLGRGKRRGCRRKNSSPRDRDYVEFQGRRISLKDDTEEDLNEEDEEDVGFSMESYERCLRGIQRVEDCIRKVDKQNELLREKYGINCESTGARLNLASPSVDHRVFPTTRNDLTSSRTSSDHDLSVPRMSLSSWCPSRVASPRSNVSDKVENGVEMEDDDIEKRIYQQLMNVADSTRYWNSRRLRQERSLKVADSSRSPKSCFKYRDKSNLMGGEVRKEGSFRVEDEFVDLGEYETSGRSKTRMRLPRFEDDFDFDDDYTINFDVREDSRIKKDDISLMRTNGVDSLTFDVSKLGTSDRMDEDDTEWYLKSSISFPVASLKKRNHEIEDFARKRDIDTKVYSFEEESLDIDTSKEVPATNTTSTEDISHFRDKLKYPGSPRARFLELLRERRRIVESSRGTGAS